VVSLVAAIQVAVVFQVVVAVAVAEEDTKSSGTR
jgi:hypothetical protein